MLNERELADFKRGPLQMLVLFMLKEEDMYGYQLAQKINQLSHGDFPVTQGALYIVLYRLIKKKYISGEKEDGVKKPRVFYHLEPSGRELLREMIGTYEAMHRGINAILESGNKKGG